MSGRQHGTAQTGSADKSYEKWEGGTGAAGTDMMDIGVTVMIPVYQHREYVEQCLCGILSQKTDFQFQILVHDDASTDGSAEIIRRYARRYPERITAIFETQNQYSQGRNIVQDILLPEAKGKYIAFCEGDDRWCDEHKLQLQYDYMELHPECSICTHNTHWREIGHPERDRKFNDWSRIRILTQEEVFLTWQVHASSYFLRKDAAVLPECLKKYWMGDFAVLTWAYTKGEAAYLPRSMSVYHAGNSAGVTWKNNHQGADFLISKENERIDYLHQLDLITEKRYHRIIHRRIKEIKKWERDLRVPYFYDRLKHNVAHHVIIAGEDMGRTWQCRKAESGVL